MKKMLMMAVMSAMLMGAKAQTLKEFEERFSSSENAEVVNLDKDQLKTAMEAAGMTGDTEQLSILMSLESVKVIDMETCSDEDRKAFCEAAANLSDDSLPLLLESKEDGENVKIFGVIESGHCKDLVVVSADLKEPAFVRITGDLDMEKLNNTKNFNLVNINGVKFP